MAVLKSPKNQSSKRTWIRLFKNKTKFLRFISKKAYFNRNFSGIPLKWNSTHNQYPPQPFCIVLENTYFSSYIYHYFLNSKNFPLKNSTLFTRTLKTYLWSRTGATRTVPQVLKPSYKTINWLMIPTLE